MYAIVGFEGLSGRWMLLKRYPFARLRICVLAWERCTGPIIVHDMNAIPASRRLAPSKGCRRILLTWVLTRSDTPLATLFPIDPGL
ncbi:predicted protein [Botrytis cinerea T4]|uniref:Uncharacterized protein n=1 Tax=Botryotinia fuckeliana (strain T4) TaxID=999810 RepID=G2YR96_BOTF4|nr:predicted protein [Botrytis cinerea T4]